MIVVPFGPWLPDLPDYANPGLTTAKGVIPHQSSYLPFPDKVTQSSALNARARGAAAAQDTAGNYFQYVGNETKLYQIQDQAATDKTRITITGSSTTSGSSTIAPYTTSANDVWEFTVYGSFLIATNYDDPVQFLTIGSSGIFSAHFTSTNKPNAKHIAVVRDQLVLGNTNDSTDGVRPSRVWWSGIGASKDMDPDATTQADFQDLPDGGAVQRIVPGVEYGLIFQEQAIRRLAYVGSPLVYDIYPIDRRRGTPVPNSVIWQGRLVFFITEEGFMATDGAESVSIGANQVDKTFWNQFDVGNRTRVSAAIDPINKLVAWLFPGSGSSAGQPNKLFIYDWQNKKWSEIDIDLQLIAATLTQSFTLESLDSITTDIDDGTLASFDSPQWQGGKYRLSGFDLAHKLVYFTGDNLAARLETGEFQHTPGQRSLLRKLRPLVDGGAVSMALAGRNRLVDTASFGSSVSLNGVGDIWIRNMARYHRARCDVAAGGTWNHAQGVEVHGTGMGDR